MDRNALPTINPAADGDPVGTIAAESPSQPPLYRSEGFAEDLLDADADAATDPRRRGTAAWLLATPLTAALLGALAATLAMPT